MSKKQIFLIIGTVIILGGLFVLNKKQDNKSPNSASEPLTTQPLSNQSSATSSAQLKIEDLRVGDGAEVTPGDTVQINYTGTLENGTKFDSSYDRGQPFETKIGVGQVIKGWDEGVVGMKVGGKRKLIIPPDLGYGSRVVGLIPASSTLIFEVELLDVKTP